MMNITPRHSFDLLLAYLEFCRDGEKKKKKRVGDAKRITDLYLTQTPNRYLQLVETKNSKIRIKS